MTANSSGSASVYDQRTSSVPDRHGRPVGYTPTRTPSQCGWVDIATKGHRSVRQRGFRGRDRKGNYPPGTSQSGVRASLVRLVGQHIGFFTVIGSCPSTFRRRDAGAGSVEPSDTKVPTCSSRRRHWNAGYRSLPAMLGISNQRVLRLSTRLRRMRLGPEGGVTASLRSTNAHRSGPHFLHGIALERNWQRTDALTGRGVDRVAHGRRDWRQGGFAQSRGMVVAVDEVHADVRRVGHPQGSDSCRNLTVAPRRPRT